MRRFEAWLQEEAGWRKAFGYLGILLAIQLVYVFCMTFFLAYLGVKPFAFFGSWNMKLSAAALFMTIASFGEEFFFRFMPLAFARLLELSIETMLAVAVISSVIFGFVHGGIPFIFVQGVFGFMWCVLFLKCGGHHGNPGKALMVTGTSHSLYNLTLLGLGFALPF